MCVSSPQKSRPCGLARRLLAMLYDSLVITALLVLAGALALPLTGASQQALRDVPYTFYLAGVWFLYLGWCWTHGGQTLGMRAWKIHINGADGGPVSWRAAGLRFAVSLVSAAAAGAGFGLSLLHPQRSCWHDRASNTRLVVADSASDRLAQHQDDSGH